MVGNIRFLTLVKPVLHVLPEVAQPDRKIPFKARFEIRLYISFSMCVCNVTSQHWCWCFKAHLYQLRVAQWCVRQRLL